jgi:hypothetical protein
MQMMRKRGAVVDSEPTVALRFCTTPCPLKYGSTGWFFSLVRGSRPAASPVSFHDTFRDRAAVSADAARADREVPLLLRRRQEAACHEQ